MIERLLELLEAPRSSGQLAHELGTTPSALEGMLGLLESRGYIERLCASPPSCGGCAVRNLCPSPGGEAQEIWRRVVPSPLSHS